RAVPAGRPRGRGAHRRHHRRVATRRGRSISRLNAARFVWPTVGAMSSNPRRKPLVLLAGLALAIGAAVLAGCSDDDGESVTIYSGRTEDLIGPILERFEDETGIDVDVRYDDSANLALLIAEEGDDTPADVFLSQSPGAVGFLEQQGRLAALPQDVLDLVPEEARADEGHWIGFSGRKRVLVYNTDELSDGELPSSVLDLAAPEWRGRIGIAPSN